MDYEDPATGAIEIFHADAASLNVGFLGVIELCTGWGCLVLAGANGEELRLAGSRTARLREPSPPSAGTPAYPFQAYSCTLCA